MGMVLVSVSLPHRIRKVLSVLIYHFLSSSIERGSPIETGAGHEASSSSSHCPLTHTTKFTSTSPPCLAFYMRPEDLNSGPCLYSKFFMHSTTSIDLNKFLYSELISS